MTARTCSTCVHSHTVQIMPEVARLECRFGPPGINGFAQTKPENWCGQHREEVVPSHSSLRPDPIPPLSTRSVTKTTTLIKPALTTRKGGKR